VSYSDVITNGFAGTQIQQVILRTWTATNNAGLSTNVIQTITVKDTTPPTLTIVPTMRLVETGDSWGFGQPIANDTCGAVTVSVFNTQTNLTATNTIMVSRTWLATDTAGNTNTCCQTVVINLGPPPTIVNQPQSQTFAYGDNGALSVTATCITPITYQWRLGGVNIAGATNSNLQFTGIQFSNAGPYTVVVSSAGGSVTSSVAVVSVFPKLTGIRAGRRLILTWPAPFVLQSASSVNGPYRDIPAAASPFSVPMSAPQQFFRLRSGPPSIDLNRAGGVSTLTLTGTQGENYILQASSNLVHWTNLHTNALPMIYVDSAASQFPLRFYRAILTD
jgi:Immunoglobulin domain